MGSGSGSCLDLDLDPKTMTLQTFKILLSKYDATVREKTRSKVVSKGKSKDQGKGKTKGKKRAAPAAANGGEEGENPDQDQDVDHAVTHAIQQFRELDAWRYDALPEALERRRAEKEEEEEEEAHLSKEEVVRLMEWKLKHGINRPMLLSMIRANTEKTVKSSTSSAFSTLASASAKSDEFQLVNSALCELSGPLKGVGPATASLLLAVCSKDVPFYSDDVFLWLVLGLYPGSAAAAAAVSTSAPAVVEESKEAEGKDGKGEDEKPKVPKSKRERKDKTRKKKSAEEKANTNKEVKQNGELNVKYNLPEYRRLWEAVKGLRVRLNGDVEDADEGERVSCADVEKVALVVRHLDTSGLVEGGEKEDGNGDGEIDGGERKRRKVD